MNTRGAARRGAVAALALGLLAAAAAADPAPTVILISWDGVRHDYPDRGRFPALARMQRDGVRAERLIPVFPTNTFPNHVSLVTGTHPDRHGIVNNVFTDRERGRYDYSPDASWIQAEPIWVAAERQGVRTAIYFWVGSETDWNGVGATYRVSPFDTRVGEAEKVDQLLAWLDLPEAERPRLLISWWHGADAVGHRKGPDHPDVAAAVAEQDAQLGRLFEGLDARDAWGHTTVILVSDHGMTPVSGWVDPGAALERAGVAARVEPFSATAHVYLEEPGSLEAAEAALSALEGAEVYRGNALPPELRFSHLTRTGDLVLIARPPRTFREPTHVKLLGILLGRLWGWHPGLHGFRPDHPDMSAVFFALGRGVARGVSLGPVRSIDVAPTVARLLSIEPPQQAEGTPIPISSVSPVTPIAAPGSERAED